MQAKLMERKVIVRKYAKQIGCEPSILVSDRNPRLLCPVAAAANGNAN